MTSEKWCPPLLFCLLGGLLSHLRQNGISLPPSEEIPEDQWQRNYKLRKTIERGELPLSRASVDVAWIKARKSGDEQGVYHHDTSEAKHLAKYMSGAPHVDMKFTQFALNERPGGLVLSSLANSHSCAFLPKLLTFPLLFHPHCG